MQVASAGEVRAKQDMIHVAKCDITPEERKEALTAFVEEKAAIYNPSKEGLQMLEQSGKRSFVEQMLEKKEEKSTMSDDTKAMKIAHSIMQGNIVPIQDERFLQEHNDKLYMAAKNIAMMRERGEEVESELEDEDRDVMGLRELVRGQGSEAESGETTGEAAGSPGVEVC